jgi:protein-arginine kinase activator protein McsA
MKLILCPHCHDVFKLQFKIKHCKCGKCFGKYTDKINATINKEAIPIGFCNSTLVQAIKKRPNSGNGKEFTAFVIPEICPTIKVIESE